MNTRKYPRTLEQAFGPYARGPIEEPKRPFDWQDRLVLSVSVIALVFIIAAELLGWLL